MTILSCLFLTLNLNHSAIQLMARWSYMVRDFWLCWLSKKIYSSPVSPTVNSGWSHLVGICTSLLAIFGSLYRLYACCPGVPFIQPFGHLDHIIRSSALIRHHQELGLLGFPLHERHIYFFA